LRRAAAIPSRWNVTFSLLVMRSMEPRRQACSTGSEGGQFRAWGHQPAFRNIQRDIPETLLAYVKTEKALLILTATALIWTYGTSFYQRERLKPRLSCATYEQIVTMWFTIFIH